MNNTKRNVFPRIAFTAVFFFAAFLLSGCGHFKTALVHPEGIGVAATWQDLPDWTQDKHAQAWPALQHSCSVMIKKQSAWKELCVAATLLPNPNDQQARAFFEQWFIPHRINNKRGSHDGLFTGYYEPILEGSRKRSKEYPHPVYQWPSDLLEIDLSSVYPDLKYKRLRGRIEGRKVIPYYKRSEIDKNPKIFKGHELCWVKDPVALVFMQIQGSGRIKFPDGEIISLGYEQQNGHPYFAIGKALVQSGMLKKEDVSMQSIRQWLVNNPKRVHEILHHDPSYVFFRVLPAEKPGPFGSMGVQLTQERSVAVDRKFIPMGAPVWLDIKLPAGGPIGGDTTMRRLMFAQDTGGAIQGAVRADVFWGFGSKAEYYAGHMKQDGRMYLLVPRDPSLKGP